MSTTLLKMILAGLGNVFLVLLLAPLFDGLIRRLTAILQSRQGPPLFQTYFDLLKLLGKEDLESGETPRLQRFAAALSLATVLAVAWLTPLGAGAPLNRAADLVLLLYLLTLCALSTLLAGLAAGSTYSLVGMSREMMSAVTLEPVLVVALVISAVQHRSLRLEALWGSSQTFYGSSLLMAVILLLAFPAFVQRVPFDVAEAETEIMGGPSAEYSGPKLALFKCAHLAKLVIYSALFVALFLPWGQTGLAWLDPVIFWAKVLLLVLVVTAVAASHARLRIDQALRYYIGLLAAAFLALILAVYGY